MSPSALRRLGLVVLVPLACSGVKEHFPPGKAPIPDPSTGGTPTTPPSTGPGPSQPPGSVSPPGGAGGAPGNVGSPAPAPPPVGTGGAGTPPMGMGGAGMPPPNMGGAPNPGPGPNPQPPPGPPGAGPGASTAPVEIGGQMVPGNKVLVFIHVGTSNMAGRSQEPSDLFNHFIWYGRALPNGRPDPRFDPDPLPYDPKIWMFTLDQKFIPAREPTASDESDEAGAGPGMGLLRAARAKWPDYHIISIGRGQSGQRGGYCQHFLERNLVTNEPWSTTPPPMQNHAPSERVYGFYNEVINRRALHLKGKVIFGGIVAMFGATEDRTGAPVPSPPAEPFLSQCLIKMAATYRAVLGDENIPFIITDMERGGGEYSYNGVLGQKVRRQVRIAQGMVPRSAILETDQIEMRDDHHYTMRGHKTWGETAVELIAKNGWDSWARQ
jgi:hypothetical protein